MIRGAHLPQFAKPLSSYIQSLYTILHQFHLIWDLFKSISTYGKLLYTYSSISYLIPIDIELGLKSLLVDWKSNQIGASMPIPKPSQNLPKCQCKCYSLPVFEELLFKSPNLVLNCPLKSSRELTVWFSFAPQIVQRINCLFSFAPPKGVTTESTASVWTWSTSRVWGQRWATSQSTSWTSARRSAWTSRTTDVLSAARPSPCVSDWLSLPLPQLRWPYLSPMACSVGGILSHHYLHCPLIS